MKEFEWWCRINPLIHRQAFIEDEWMRTRNNQPKCCGRTMALQDKKIYPITNCNRTECKLANHNICRCWCEGKYHGVDLKDKEYTNVVYKLY